MMHVMYFGRTYYGTELWIPTMENQGSIGYLVIQLFSSQLLGLYPDYDTTPVTLLCGDAIFSYQFLAVRPAAVPGMLDHGTGHARYPFKTHALY